MGAGECMLSSLNSAPRHVCVFYARVSMGACICVLLIKRGYRCVYVRVVHVIKRGYGCECLISLHSPIDCYFCVYVCI